MSKIWPCLTVESNIAFYKESYKVDNFTGDQIILTEYLIMVMTLITLKTTGLIQILAVAVLTLVIAMQGTALLWELNYINKSDFTVVYP